MKKNALPRSGNAPAAFWIAVAWTAAFLTACDGRGGAAQAGFAPRDRGARAQSLGRQIYAHYCAHCHGAEGRGDGLNAYNLRVKPPDFSDPRFQGSRSDEDIEKFIGLGGRRSGKSALCPEWGKTLTAPRIGFLRSFIRALGSGANGPGGGFGGEPAAGSNPPS